MDDSAKHQITSKQAKEHEVIKRAIVLQESKAEKRAAHPDREAVIAAIGCERAGNEIGHLTESERDHYEVDALRAQTHGSSEIGENRADQQRRREGNE